MEMKKDGHFSVARLEECAFDVAVHHVHLVTAHRGVAKAIGVSPM
jgi:hypothetical protein